MNSSIHSSYIRIKMFSYNKSNSGLRSLPNSHAILKSSQRFTIKTDRNYHTRTYITHSDPDLAWEFCFHFISPSPAFMSGLDCCNMSCWCTTLNFSLSLLIWEKARSCWITDKTIIREKKRQTERGRMYPSQFDLCITLSLAQRVYQVCDVENIIQFALKSRLQVLMKKRRQLVHNWH